MEPVPNMGYSHVFKLRTSKREYDRGDVPSLHKVWCLNARKACGLSEWAGGWFMYMYINLQTCSILAND